MGEFTRENYEDMEKCFDEIHELVEEERKNKFFLNHSLNSARELEKKIQFYQRLLSSPQTKPKK